MARGMVRRAAARQLEIIHEINRRFLGDVRGVFPADEGRVQRVSLIEEGAKKVRMAHLAVVGSHSTNGVAEILETKLYKTLTSEQQRKVDGLLRQSLNAGGTLPLPH